MPIYDVETQNFASQNTKQQRCLVGTIRKILHIYNWVDAETHIFTWKPFFNTYRHLS